jgi:hypothetical protein
MPEKPGSNAERAFAICSLFESEILVWLLLRNWQHPLAEDAEYRNELLETATAVLDEAAHGSRNDVFIEGLPAREMNFIAAVWYAEYRALDDILAKKGTPEFESRVAWLEAVRKTVPSCFCSPDDLP